MDDKNKILVKDLTVKQVDKIRNLKGFDNRYNGGVYEGLTLASLISFGGSVMWQLPSILIYQDFNELVAVNGLGGLALLYLFNKRADTYNYDNSLNNFYLMLNKVGTYQLNDVDEVKYGTLYNVCQNKHIIDEIILQKNGVLMDGFLNALIKKVNFKEDDKLNLDNYIKILTLPYQYGTKKDIEELYEKDIVDRFDKIKGLTQTKEELELELYNKNISKKITQV